MRCIVLLLSVREQIHEVPADHREQGEERREETDVQGAQLLLRNGEGTNDLAALPIDRERILLALIADHDEPDRQQRVPDGITSNEELLRLLLDGGITGDRPSYELRQCLLRAIISTINRRLRVDVVGGCGVAGEIGGGEALGIYKVEGLGALGTRGFELRRCAHGNAAECGGGGTGHLVHIGLRVVVFGIRPGTRIRRPVGDRPRSRAIVIPVGDVCACRLRKGVGVAELLGKEEFARSRPFESSEHSLLIEGEGDDEVGNPCFADATGSDEGVIAKAAARRDRCRIGDDLSAARVADEGRHRGDLRLVNVSRRRGLPVFARLCAARQWCRRP